ncbi:MAG: NAD(P)-binding domain-containing protein, partial [Scardovia wiggsiae]|nr:NAD(P)-binding domain-containing protein [Scardovia wiggsiae]
MTDTTEADNGAAGLASTASQEAQANIGVIGLGVMGASLARNLAHHGNTVAVYNRHTDRTEEFMKNYGSEGAFIPSDSLQSLADSLEKPRKVILMITAGHATDAVIEELLGVFEPEDIIIDGGNSYFEDTIRREKDVRARGLHFVGCGISGGEEGALNGPSMMPGGTD